MYEYFGEKTQLTSSLSLIKLCNFTSLKTDEFGSIYKILLNSNINFIPNGNVSIQIYGFTLFQEI